MLRGLRRLRTVIDAPLEELDARATGAEVTWFREALASTQRSDPYWVARDFAAGVEQVSAPVQLIGGWYDIFLPWMLEDFAALQAAGRAPQLIIGPWTHTSPGLMRAGLRDGIGWLRSALLHDDRLARRAPVRILVTGERSGGGWRDLAQWPPPDTGERKLWLAEGGALRDAPPLAAGVDAYHYDPAAPTPSLGGPVLLAREPVVDNRPLEARPDVLTFDSAPLPAVVEAIGPVRIELHVRASAPQVDVFARVCDVDADGASWNVCDALARARPGPVAFDLWPMGHRFAAGHRIRLQVSSGAHPRYARPPAAIDVEILHGPEHPSALVLPRS
jgi:hypothetical protein